MAAWRRCPWWGEKKKVQNSWQIKHQSLRIAFNLWPTGEINKRRMLRPVWSVWGNHKIINKKIPAFKIKKHGMMNGAVTAKRSGFRSILSCVVCGHKTTDVFSGSRRGRRTLCSHTLNQHFFLCHVVVPGPWEIDTASTAPQNPFMLVWG